MPLWHSGTLFSVTLELRHLGTFFIKQKKAKQVRLRPALLVKVIPFGFWHLFDEVVYFFASKSRQKP
jgi:hypothetical protein